MNFLHQRPPSFGGSNNPSRPGRMGRGTYGSSGWAAVEPWDYLYLPMPKSAEADLALAVFREGLSVNSVPFSFLSFFKVLNIRFSSGPDQKGKVEKGAIHYIRYNFFPLRSFDDLKDLQHQADQWRDHVANIRLHSTTGERPIDRFKSQTMRSLPPFLPDCRDTASAKIYPDFSVRFDANSYTVPPWAIGRLVIVKADTQTLFASKTRSSPPMSVPINERSASNYRHTMRPHESNNVDSGNHNMSVPSSAWVKRLKFILNALPVLISLLNKT